METVPLNPCCTDIYFRVADTLGHFKPQQVPGGFQLGHISSWASTAEEALQQAVGMSSKHLRKV